MRPSRVLLSTVTTLALAACSQTSMSDRADRSGAAASSRQSAATTQGPSGLSAFLPHSGITSKHVADEFNFTDVATESRGKPVPLVLLGDPFGADRQALGQAIAQDLQGSGWAGSGVTFAPTTGAALVQSRARDDRSISPYSLVMMINGPANVTAQNLCSNPGAEPRAAAAPANRAGSQAASGSAARSGTAGASGSAPQSGSAAGASSAPSGSAAAAAGATGSAITVISALCRFDKEVSGVVGKTSVTGVQDPRFRSLVNATLAEMAGPEPTVSGGSLKYDR